MQRLIQLIIAFVLVLAITERTFGQTEPFVEDDVGDDTNMADMGKRDWNTLRLGRALQMLRLGKRAPVKQQLSGVKLDHPDYDDLKSLSASDLQAILGYLMDEPRDQFRRQPPLPRYGRDSNGVRRVSSDDLSDYEVYRLLFSRLPTRQAGKPTPRGGRYRRSTAEDYLGWIATYRNLVQPRYFMLPQTGRTEKVDSIKSDQSKAAGAV